MQEFASLCDSLGTRLKTVGKDVKVPPDTRAMLCLLQHTCCAISCTDMGHAYLPSNAVASVACPVLTCALLISGGHAVLHLRRQRQQHCPGPTFLLSAPSRVPGADVAAGIVVVVVVQVWLEEQAGVKGSATEKLQVRCDCCRNYDA